MEMRQYNKNSKLAILEKRLLEIPDAYDSFVSGIIVYVKKKPERLRTVLNFWMKGKT